MDLIKKKGDFVEYIENTLSDYSSFEELFEVYEEDFLLEKIENDDLYEKIEIYIENEEYSYFMNFYLKAIESVMKSFDEKSFYLFIEDFLEEELKELTEKEINSFFNW